MLLSTLYCSPTSGRQVMPSKLVVGKCRVQSSVSLVDLHSKKFYSMLHQKEALVCWLQKFVLSCTIFWFFYMELFAILGCNSPLIMMQLKTNFRSQKINASVWCNIGQKFIECSFRSFS